MKRIKLYEEFVNDLSRTDEAATTPKDSKVTVDDYMMDDGTKIESTEIVGVMVSAESEAEFKDYFYDKYGMTAFTENDISTLTTYFNEYLEEINAEEAEAEKAAEGEESPEGDLASEIDALEKE